MRPPRRTEDEDFVDAGVSTRTADDTLYARAVPQKAELTETYVVEQEISRNPSVDLVGDGTGRIEVSMPYDGYRYFTRQAVADVQRWLGSGGVPGDQRAVTGYLLLADHTRTSGLRGVMRHHNQAGVIPLSVPVATRDGTPYLTGDRQTCVTTYDYRPGGPDIIPIDLYVGVHDLDSLTDDLDSMSGAFDSAGVFATARNLVSQGRDHPSLVIEKLRQTASFSSELLLSFSIRISIPVKAGYRQLDPVVLRMSVEWPTLTSLRSTKLLVQNLGRDAAAKPVRDEAVRYNPVLGRLEWTNVPSREETSAVPTGSAGTRVYRSAVGMLRVGHPGELFKEDMLEVHARVEIPNYLLSGLEARLFSATGHPHAAQPAHTTKLDIRTRVYPGDIFAGRAFSPYRQFVFDDIMPDEKRVTDVVNVLRNAGFTVDPPQAQPDAQAPTWLLMARRSQGPDDLDLLIAIEGRRDTLDREELMGASVRITGTKESGQLTLSVLGTLRRDHRELTRVMNALQQEVRDRFRFHQLSGKSGS